jgi:quercetin dioxygenase-like cupin family protein
VGGPGRDDPVGVLQVLSTLPFSATPTTPPYHQHAWEHEVSIVSGSGMVKSEHGDRPFAAGDAVFIPGEELHCFAAETAVRFVCVIPSPNACQRG